MKAQSEAREIRYDARHQASQPGAFFDEALSALSVGVWSGVALELVVVLIGLRHLFVDVDDATLDVNR